MNALPGRDPVGFGWRGFSLAKTGRRTRWDKLCGQSHSAGRLLFRSQIWAVLHRYHNWLPMLPIHMSTWVSVHGCQWLPIWLPIIRTAFLHSLAFSYIQLHSLVAA